MDNFDSYNVLLSIATNIPVLLMTAFVLQGHKYINIYLYTHTQSIYELFINVTFYYLCLDSRDM